MTRTLLAVCAVAVLALLAAPAAANHTKNAGDEASARQAIMQALQAYRGDQSEDNRKALERAAEEYLENHADGEFFTNALNIRLQLFEIAEDWQGILDFVGNLGDLDETGQVLTTGYAGIAHANLGNTDEANEALEKLEGFEGEAAQWASSFSRRIGGIVMYREPGAEAPDFTLTTVDGESEVSLSEFEGKYVLLDFWATWCGPCVRVANTYLKPLWERYRNEDFVLIGVGTSSRDTAEAQKRVAEQHGWDWTKVFDSDNSVTSSYHVSAYPFLVLIDPEGNIVGGAAGGRLFDTINETLEKAFGGDAEEGEEDEGDDSNGAFRPD